MISAPFVALGINSRVLHQAGPRGGGEKKFFFPAKGEKTKDE
jgi:hypothetical protein